MSFLEYIQDDHLFWGLSPDKEHMTHYIINTYNLPHFIKSLVFLMEDVYWLALFIYYGILGLGIFVFILYLFYNQIRKIEVQATRNSITHNSALMCKVLILSTIPLNFIMQAFEVRHFSFYFWAMLGFLFLFSFSKNSQFNHKVT